MLQSFKPKDIIKGRVISLGDSLRGIYLTTAAEGLGVVVAEEEETGRLMLPFDWNWMVEPEGMRKEARKVCKPE
jgi:exosome complex RNA-binding protein Csl4